MEINNPISESNDPLNHLLIQAEKDTTKLWVLVMSYTNLISSSKTDWIDFYLDKVIRVLNKWKGSVRTVDALFHITQGFSLYFLSKPQEALDEFNKVFDCCDKTELFRNIRGPGHMGRGVCYRNLGKLDKTMEDSLMASQLIHKEDPANPWHVFVFRMLGEIHTYIGELDEAKKYYLKAKSIMESISDSNFPTVRFRVNDALGNCHNQMGELEKAEKYLQTAIKVNGISQAERARGLCDMGILYLENPEKALSYFEESCAIRQEQNLEDAYTTSLIYKGQCMIKLNRLEQAEQILNEAKTLVEKYNVPTKKLHLYEQMRTLLEKQENYSEANKYFHLYNDLKNEIHAQQSKNIFHLKNKLIADQHHEIEQKHAELKNTLHELARIKVSRKALFFSIITLVVLVILTEVFLDPIIEQYSDNQYLGLASKIFIAFMLKPIDSLYERLLFRKAVKAEA
ncbi:MAG: tetratricopeptide repeat protein [Cyclobacteriaceae bacterium]|nr:tetratricopeptide repeat protein [Cyclobacteriaceae bacterium]